MNDPKKPWYKPFGNYFNICGLFSNENFQSALEYEAKDDDLFIVSYPKCGSTWTQHIIYLILHNGIPLSKDEKMGDFVPFIDICGKEIVEKKTSPRIIKTHLPYGMIPKNPKSKYIFIVRNPKDTLVSFFHHTRGFVESYNYADGLFDDYFDLFIKGEIDYGDYFDHLLSWYPHTKDNNFLFLTYESMKKEPRTNILAIANFIDKKYFDLLSINNEILENVIKYSHVSEMIKDDQRWYRTKRIEDSKFVRKGIIGDWRNHLSEEQSKQLNEKIRKKFDGTDLESLWSTDVLY